MTKKITALLIILCMILSVTGCNKNTGDEEAVLKSESYSEEDTSDIADGGDPIVPEAEVSYDEVADGDTSASSTGYSSTNGANYDTKEDYVVQGVTTNDNGFIPQEEDPQYGKIIENTFIKTADEDTSTFAADVDTASYSNIRRYLAQDTAVPADAVRVEEMINYFNYDYGTPKEGEPFSVVCEIFDSPWSENKLIRIGLATEEPDYDALPASNLVFLVDVSGSMDSANKLPLAKQAFSMLTENLKPDDRISIVTYASSDSVLIEGKSADSQLEIQTAIENMTAGGGTHGSQGIITAYEIAEKYFIEGGNNRVILATDGDLNIGVTSTDALTDLIIEKKKSGIYLSVMGFGTDNLMDNKLESIADNGNGNYSYIDSSLEARKVLIEEMGGTLFTVAKDVKLQMQFNADAVEEYKLVGYENRVMANEDFEDDSKDGGEIGAGHRVTVIYEVKTKDESQDKWFDLNIRYKEPDADKSELLTYSFGKDSYTETPNEDSIFAMSVAQFGMALRNSDNIIGDCSNILNRIKDLKCVKDDVYKKEFLGFVKLVARE